MTGQILTAIPAPRSTLRQRLQTRYILAGGGALAVVLALIVIAQSLYVYASAYQSFQNVALDSKAKIEASDAAIGAIAQVSTDVVDSVIKSTNATTTINSDFDAFRKVMFTVTRNLDAGPETDAFNQAEVAVYDEFWPHISAMLTAKNRGDMTTAVQEYAAADAILEQKVIANLTTVEQDNFTAMQHTEQGASAAISLQLFFLVFLAGSLAIIVTVLSLWLRQKIRRYLTPGLDLALILAWLLLLAMFGDISQAPGQMKSLVEDSYYSVSATQRILAIAAQANRTESAEILDAPNAAKWQQMFDGYDVLIQQALCGEKGCINTPFTTQRADTIDSAVVDLGNQNIQQNSTTGLKIVPLVSNVTYSGEPQAIEQSRATYVDYLTIDRQIRNLVAQNQLQAATAIDTGTSDVAFGKFTDAVQLEQKINLDQFISVWQTVQNTLPAHRLLFGLGGYILLVGLLGLGVYHRYREL